jgi:hypothetical protein
MTGLNGWSGTVQAPRLLLIAAAVSALVPSAHELKDRWLGPSPVLALAAAALAAYCILQVGQGAPLNFIYFQF